MEAPRISLAPLIAFSAIFLATFSNSATAFSILEGFDAPFRARPCLATRHLSSCRLRTTISSRTYSTTRLAKDKISMANAQGSHSDPSFDENEAIALGLGAGTRPVVPGDAPPETTTTLVVPHHHSSRRKMMTMLLAVGVRDLSVATGAAVVEKAVESQRDSDQSLDETPASSGLFSYMFMAVAASRLFQEGICMPRLKLSHWTLPQPAARIKNAAASFANQVSTELNGSMVKKKSQGFYVRLAAGLAVIVSSVEASASGLFK